MNLRDIRKRDECACDKANKKTCQDRERKRKLAKKEKQKLTEKCRCHCDCQSGECTSNKWYNHPDQSSPVLNNIITSKINSNWNGCRSVLSGDNGKCADPNIKPNSFCLIS